MSKYSLNKNMHALNAFFAKLDHKISIEVPRVVARTATEYFRESFRTKSFNGSAWAPVKKVKKKGSLMIKSGALYRSIQPALVSPSRVVISAGSSRVPYAKIHNEGGKIERSARSETFVRNRYVRGAKSKYFGGMGAFKKGTTPGNGLSFKAYTITMPKRQFMGHTPELNRRIISNIKVIWKLS